MRSLRYSNNPASRPRLRTAQIAAASLLAVLICAGCPRPAPELNPAKHASPSAGQQHSPGEPIRPEREFVDESGAVPVPTAQGGKMALPDLIDIGLRNSPGTRMAWAQAKARAANWGRSRSAYYPWFDAELDGLGGRMPQIVPDERSYFQATVGLSYLLLDFGGRKGKAEAARQALVAANWNHNQAIQDLLRDVPQAYYSHLADRARVKASQQSLNEAGTTLRATEERKNAGVSTIADVLQARSREAKARLDLASAAGSSEISKGRLATSVGWPANAPIDVEDGFESPPLRKLGASADGLIEEAKRARPDIGAAEAQVMQKKAELKEARSLPFPKLNATGNVGWLTTEDYDDKNYYGGVTLQIPIFHGFDMENAVRAAKAELEAAQEELRLRNEKVIQEVWNAYQNYRTAAEQLSASRALLSSAGESFDASLARYRVGAADIVELLNAQSTLADARSQVIGATSSLYTYYAELLHAVGSQVPGVQLPDADGTAGTGTEISYGEDK